MTFKPYPKFKASGVEWLGDVPGGWDVVRLKHACHVFPSNVDKKMHDGEIAVRLCNYTDVYYNDVISEGLNFMAASATAEQITKFTLRAGDTIITKDSETADDIAIAAYVPQDMPGIVCGYHLSMVRPIGGTCGAFMKRFFDSSYAKSSFAIRANGLTRVGLGQYALDNVEMALPSSDEQVSIAAFLDRETTKIDTLIAKQEAMISLLQEKRQAVISHAVTKGLDPNVSMKNSGVEWLGDVPKHWDVCGFTKYLGPIIDYRGRTPTKIEDGVLLLTARNIKNGRIDYTASQEFISADEYPFVMQRGLPEIDDVLFTMEAPLGQVANIDRTDIALAQRIVKFRGLPGVVDNFYLKYWIMGTGCQCQLEQLGTGSTALGIKSSKLGQIQFCFPTIDEQRNIVTHLDSTTIKIDTLVAKAQQAIALQKEHRTALISAAVTGKIDVRNEVAERKAA